MTESRSILFFLGCALLGMSLGSALALLIAHWAGGIDQIDSLSHFVQQVTQLPNGWYIIIAVQAVSHLSSYLVPALIYWYLVEKRYWADFQEKPLDAVSGLWIGLLSVIAILPFNEHIIDWNQHLPLPALLGSVGEWMYRKEQESGLLTAQLVAFNSIHQLLIAVVVIGCVAATGEELFFRGVIQRKLMEWTKKCPPKHLAGSHSIQCCSLSILWLLSQANIRVIIWLPILLVRQFVGSYLSSPSQQ